jgi:hypothetical protein
MTKLSHGQKHYDRKQIAEEFVREWVSSNVSPLPGLVDVARQVDTLACQMTADARLQGISGGEIAEVVGNIDDFLTQECQLVPIVSGV